MRLALKLVTIAAVLVVTSTASIFTLAGAAILVVSPRLQDRSSNWTHVATFKPSAKLLDLDTRAAAHVEAPRFMHDFDDRIAVAFNALAEVPLTTFSLSASPRAIMGT